MNPSAILIFVTILISNHAIDSIERINFGHFQNERFHSGKEKFDFQMARKIFGYGHDDFKSIFSTVYDYFRSGFHLLSGGINQIISVATRSTAGKVSYRGYQVLRIDVTSEDEIDRLKELPEEMDGVEFWTPPTENHFTDLLVSPDSAEEVKRYLRGKKIDHEIMIGDLQKVITSENPKMNKEQRDALVDRRGHPMTWMRYHRYLDMIRYMEFLAFNHPDRVDLLTIGYTAEGLPLKVIKVASKKTGRSHDDGGKPAIWIDGGIHGREWITSSVVLYAVKELVENHGKHRKMAESAIWYFLPVANPDGYEYSHTTDRLWKKNRSRHVFSGSNFVKNFLFGSSCEGVDLNRNFDFHWGGKDVSVDPCRENFAGPRPFSEPETRAISDFVMLKKDSLKMFVTFHSYSQKWLIPWSYTTRKANDYKEMKKIAKKATQAMALMTGSHYDVGPSASLAHPTSGSSVDWAKGMADIKYSYAIKLRDRGSFGFLLPAAQIVPTAKEVFVALKVLANSIPSKIPRPPQRRCGT